MGKLIRTTNWNQTPLGDPINWPQSLKTTVSIVLNNPSAMYIAWGKEYTQIYNDSYQTILEQSKHPKALGKSTKYSLSEVWDKVQPMLDCAMKGEPVRYNNLMLPLDRNGQIEECYFDFSYTPIYIEADKIGGVLVTITETKNEKIDYSLNATIEDITKQNIARKKLEQSERDLKLMVHQAPIAISIMRGSDYVVEIANKFALKLWGKEEKEVLNKSIFTALPELLPQGIKELLDNVIATGNRFATTELEIEMVRYGILETIYVNFSYEPLFDDEGKTNGIMAIGFDVTDQFLVRQKIEKSEQSLRSLVESAPFPIGVYTGKEMRISLANQSIINVWGKGNEVIGKLYSEILPELENQNIFQQLDAVFTTGIAYHTSNQRIDIVRDGILKSYYFNYSFTPLFDSTGNIYGVMNTAAEVTELNQIKQKIEESEKRFRDAVQQAPVGIVIFKGKDNIVEMANTLYLKLVDKTEDEFIGKSIYKSLPDVEETIAPIINNIYKTGKAFYGYEFPVTLNRFGKKEITYFNFVYHPLIEFEVVTGIIVVATEVTATVIAKNSLEESEQKLNIVINASELGTWELDIKTEQTKISDRALEILGLKNKKYNNHQDLIKNIHPDDLIIRETAFQKAFKTGLLHYEIRTIIDGITYWMEAKGKVFFNSENEPVRMLGTLRDISDEKNFQSQLLEREQKFRLLADSMPQFIWTADLNGNLNYFNKAVFSYSGLSPEEINKKGWLEIVHHDDKEENIKKWKESIVNEKDFLLEHRFRKSDGTYRWQLSRAIPQRDSEGKITMWVGTSTDIQDQKMFSNELERLVNERTKELVKINESLEESEERYHLMVEEIQDYAIIYFNHIGIIENWNIGAQKIKGYKTNEIVGKHFSIFYTEADQKNNLPQQLLNTAKEKGKASQEGWRVKKNGKLFWAYVVITAVHNNKNELIGFSKITHDLTEKKEAEDKLKQNGLELQQKNIELEKMNKELQSFAYISSHDLQEPLRKIQTFATQINDREAQNLSESGKEKFKRMQYAANRMQNLIQDLLAYSRTSITEQIFENTKLSTIIEEVKEDLEIELQLKKAKIIINKDCNLKVIPFQFRQLLFNLISNSIKFTAEETIPEITITCNITLGSELQNENLNSTSKYCHISIQDNGIGFEEEYNDKIFEVFQRLHGKEKYNGTGIGLAIVKKIIENHNGFISAKGILNQGATFDIYLPI